MRPDPKAVVALAVAGVMAASCATVAPERRALDARAASANDAAEHLAIAADYRELAVRELEDAASHHRLGFVGDAMGYADGASRPAYSHRRNTGPQWHMQALSEERAAMEALLRAWDEEELAAGRKGR